MDTDPTAISASSSRPVRTTSTVMYQTSRQSMTAEARESLANGQSPRSASHERPSHPLPLHRRVT